jgi:hypothetical protein
MTECAKESCECCVVVEKRVARSARFIEEKSTPFDFTAARAITAANLAH